MLTNKAHSRQGQKTHRKHVTNIRPYPREHEYLKKNRKSSVNKNNQTRPRRVLCNQKRDPSNEIKCFIN